MSERPAQVPPPGARVPLTLTSGALIGFSEVLWRIHPTQGEHAPPWNHLRTRGPVARLRWDPHPPGPPATEHRDHGVLYAAPDPATALAQAFATTRVIDTYTGSPHLTGWSPTRPLALLDLVHSRWARRTGTAAALAVGDPGSCRAWAREVHAQLPTVDGLLVPSALSGRPAVVLWLPARDSFPSAPGFSRPVAYPLVWSAARAVAQEIGYDITG